MRTAKARPTAAMLRRAAMNAAATARMRGRKRNIVSRRTDETRTAKPPIHCSIRYSAEARQMPAGKASSLLAATTVGGETRRATRNAKCAAIRSRLIPHPPMYDTNTPPPMLSARHSSSARPHATNSVTTASNPPQRATKTHVRADAARETTVVPTQRPYAQQLAALRVVPARLRWIDEWGRRGRGVARVE